MCTNVHQTVLCSIIRETPHQYIRCVGGWRGAGGVVQQWEESQKDQTAEENGAESHLSFFLLLQKHDGRGEGQRNAS